MKFLPKEEARNLLLSKRAMAKNSVTGAEEEDYNVQQAKQNFRDHRREKKA